MKNKRMASFFVSLAAMLLASPALAHHGFAGRYDEEHPVTVNGNRGGPSVHESALDHLFST